jgi:hypothetical protein
MRIRPLLLAAAALSLAVPAEAAHAQATQVDDVVSALRASPLYVAPDAKPTLSVAEQATLRRTIANDAHGPVYIAVLPAAATDQTGGDPG